MLIEVVSTHGSFLVSKSGLVKDVELDAEFGALPVYVNWYEWCKAYPDEKKLPGSVDILDIGFITADGVYNEPEQDWRNSQRNEARDAAANAAKLQRFLLLLKDADQLLIDNAYLVTDWTCATDVDKEFNRVLAFSYTVDRIKVEEVFSAQAIYNGLWTADSFGGINEAGHHTTIQFLRVSNLLTEPATC